MQTAMRHIGLVVTLALVLAACGEEVSGPPNVVGDDEPLLQITSEGGFVPVEVALSTGPRHTLLGDGRLIYTGAQIAIHPSPLLPPYFVVSIREDQMQTVLDLVADIGLPEMEDEVDDSAASFVADASTEVIRYWDDSGEHRLSVYALGIEESPSARNQAFLDLMAVMDQLAVSEGAEEYRGERVRVLAGTGFVDPEVADVRGWPLEATDFTDWETLPNGWYCTTYGSDVLTLFADATSATQWQHPDERVAVDPLTLLVRPLHPGETDCP